jgi:hypothetical protein
VHCAIHPLFSIAISASHQANRSILHFGRSCKCLPSGPRCVANTALAASAHNANRLEKRLRLAYTNPTGSRPVQDPLQAQKFSTPQKTPSPYAVPGSSENPPKLVSLT